MDEVTTELSTLLFVVIVSLLAFLLLRGVYSLCVTLHREFSLRREESASGTTGVEEL